MPIVDRSKKQSVSHSTESLFDIDLMITVEHYNVFIWLSILLFSATKI